MKVSPDQMLNLMENQLAMARQRIQELIRGEHVDWSQFEDQYWETKRRLERYRRDRASD